MVLVYGSYQFVPNSCYVSVRQQAELNAAGVPYLNVTTVTVQGRLYGINQTALALEEAVLKAALRVPFQNLFFLRDDNGPTAIQLRNADCIGGVVVESGPNFESRQGVEYACVREFTFSVRGKLPILNAATALYSFTETMEYTGGGPEYVFKRAINGPPQKQLAWAATEYRLTQFGEAVGFAAYPFAPPPAFPGALLTSPNALRRSPEKQGYGSYLKYPITWRYEMASALPLLAVPNLWR